VDEEHRRKREELMAAESPEGKAGAAKSKSTAVLQELIGSTPGIKQADLLAEASARGVSNKKVIKLLAEADWVSCRVGARGVKKYWLIPDALEEDAELELGDD
jgi:hypothetical protein